MKKFISLAIVAVMLVSVFAVNTSAANTYIPKGVEVPMFTKAPDLDGVITKEEWVGEPSVVFSVNEASEANSDGVSAQNVFFDNTYCELSEEDKAAMSTEMWFRYDANYLYVAAIVHDPTGSFNDYTDKDNLWNGDNIQIKIDPQGPNSAMYKLDPNYNWKTTPFSNDVFTWEVWDDELGEMRPAKNNELKLDWFKNVSVLADYTAAISYDTVAGYNNATGTPMSNLAVACVPTTGDAVDICYEMALPWSEIYAGFPNLAPAEGTALGIVVGVTENYGITMAESWRCYDSCYSWGTGLYGGQALVAPDTIGGTNALVLLGADTARTPYEEYVPKAEDNTTSGTTDSGTTDSGVSGSGSATDNTTDTGSVNKSPQTGDNLMLIALLIAVSVAAAVVLTKKRLVYKK